MCVCVCVCVWSVPGPPLTSKERRYPGCRLSGGRNAGVQLSAPEAPDSKAAAEEEKEEEASGKPAGAAAALAALLLALSTALPKSTSLTRWVFASRMRFGGLMSPWTMPWKWR